MEDQTVKIVGEIGQCQLGFSAYQADGADEQTITVLLMGEDMFDASTDG